MFYLQKPLPRARMLALCLALLGGLLFSHWWSVQQQSGAALREGTLRLHIRADSDSVFDQSCKLAVRDELLALAEKLCGGAQTQQQALAIAARRLPVFQLAAGHTLARFGARAAVRVSLVNMYFPTRGYDGFTLPAGRYDALRVDIGAPDSYGQNWWCVLYPGLCRAACGGYDDPAQQELVCGEYLLRLRAVEWWQQLTASRSERVLIASG